MNAIETHALTRRYSRTEALAGLNLAVPEGAVFALLGPNGAGKSTTLKILMNLLSPSSGTATVLGVDSQKLGPDDRTRIGYISENQKLPLWMSVRQLLDYCRPFYPTWDRNLEARLLEQFDLPPERKLRHLSRGMLMKAALLSSLAYRPKLLVLDEPFSGLDPLSRDDFVQGIIEASELGEWTVLIASHDIEEVERFADHIGLLEDGRLRISETTESLLRRFRRIELRDASPGARPTPMPAAWLDWEQSGDLVRYVDTKHDPAIQAVSPASMTAQSMSLREILIVLARQQRLQRKGVAA
ncbi:MAG TPA: ABC transporter ATP-binding protein [Candidatus Didemnitutus sp.]|nr:ABC transporter ATP-binding protein [Candidatus Didemnitutus sp.]